MGSSVSIDSLIDVVDEEEPQVSRQAAQALLELGPGARAVLEASRSPYAVEALALDAIRGGADDRPRAPLAGSFLGTVVTVAGWFFIVYSIAINVSFLILTLLAMLDFASYRRKVQFAAYDESFAEPLARGVSVLMPAYNEELTIVASVQAMTSLRYPDFEVIVIDDGSKDDTVRDDGRGLRHGRVPAGPGADGGHQGRGAAPATSAPAAR